MNCREPNCEPNGKVFYSKINVEKRMTLLLTYTSSNGSVGGLVVESNIFRCRSKPDKVKKSFPIYR